MFDFWSECLILMRLYSPVDLTGNVSMIEKLVLSGIEPRTSWSLAQRANPRVIKTC